MTVTFLCTIPVDTFFMEVHSSSICRYQCEGDKLFSLFALSELVCTKHILLYFIIPSTLSPQASSPLEHYRWTEGQISSLLPTSQDQQIDLTN